MVTIIEIKIIVIIIMRNLKKGDTGVAAGRVKPRGWLVEKHHRGVVHLIMIMMMLTKMMMMMMTRLTRQIISQERDFPIDEISVIV